MRERLERLKRLAWLLDASFRLPGTKFRLGLDAVIGLVPGGGTVIMTLVSLYIVWEARRMGAPMSVLVRMLVNVALEAAIDFVPLVGDLIDAAFKANLRNVALLEDYLNGKLL
ncbi:DUF4112 domain-containing protein [Acetobacter sp. LMG 1636]|uniref:DUF4112 domain-containing protein n=1 Tax=Acetobacter fallax TaxID=1737473 RepID=A0ABX0K442_9PROT|nr:DUF4112 domain-containing protein [Acetobacter fallax]NHO34653.1 DUF4112 domain-containing protein [Acetobacter fallax]